MKATSAELFCAQKESNLKKLSKCYNAVQHNDMKIYGKQELSNDSFPRTFGGNFTFIVSIILHKFHADLVKYVYTVPAYCRYSISDNIVEPVLESFVSLVPVAIHNSIKKRTREDIEYDARKLGAKSGG